MQNYTLLSSNNTCFPLVSCLGSVVTKIFCLCQLQFTVCKWYIRCTCTLSLTAPLRLCFLIWSYKNLEFPINKAFKTIDNYRVNQLKRFPVSIHCSVFKSTLQEILCRRIKAEIFTASHCTKGSGEKKRKFLAL